MEAKHLKIVHEKQHWTQNSHKLAEAAISGSGYEHFIFFMTVMRTEMWAVTSVVSDAEQSFSLTSDVMFTWVWNYSAAQQWINMKY